MNFSEWCKVNNYDEETLRTPEYASQLSHLQAAFMSATSGAVGGGNGSADLVTPSDEAQRVERIRAMAREWADKNESRPEKATALQALGERAITAGWSEDKTNLEMLRADRAVGRIINTPRPGNGAMAADVLTASLCLHCGAPEAAIGKECGEQVMNLATSADHRNAGFHSLIRNTLAGAGEQVPFGRINGDHIRKAFELSRPGGMMAGGGASVSTYSLPGILGATVNKIALAAWNTELVTWRTLAKKTPVKDFKLSSSYRMTAGGTFKLNPPAGEIKHESLVESAYTLQLATYAAMLGISRQDMINDDLSMLSDIPKLFGRGAAVLIEKLFYTRFLNNGAFFVAGNKNVSAGVLALAGLDAAYKVFLNQTDENGDPVLVQPRYLLAPPSLIMTARSLVLRDSKIVTGNAADRTDGNAWAGLLEPITSPYLENAALTGFSAVAYYLLAGPGDFSCVQVGFLDGVDAPTTETADLDFSTLGMSIRSFIDVGVAFLEPRGGVRSTGA